MTAKERQLVRESFVELGEVAEPLALLFYGRLFALEPGLRRMFPADMAGQSRKLMAMLGAAVERLEDWEGLVPVLEDLGRRHQGYGVKAHHYALVLEAMLWSIGQTLSGGAGPELRQAWRQMLVEVATAMQAKCEVGGYPTDAKMAER